MIMSSGWRTLLHCCLACVLLAGRFSVSAQRLGSCISAGNDVDCVLQLCSSRITINSSAGVDCKTRVENGRSLNGMVCNRLADAIESIALGHTAPSSISSCIVLDVYPTETGAPHLVPGLPVGDQRRDIPTNLVLRGVGDGASSAGGRGKRQTGGRDPPGSTTTPPPPLSTSPPATGQPPRVEFEALMGGEVSEARYVLQFGLSQLVAFKNIEFIGSFGIIGADRISVMAVEDCSFTGFIQGALDIFNSPTVIVRTSNFSGNGFVTTIKSESYRGHAGAISIAYIQDSPAPYINISNCVFYNNSAELAISSTPSLDNVTEGEGGSSPPSFTSSRGPPSRGMPGAKPSNELQAIRGGVIEDQSFPGRGGGVALIFSVNRSSVRATIEDCLFSENAALELGGGAYVLLDGLANHTVTINRTRFEGNVSPSTAGGLQITFLQEGRAGRQHQVLVEDCTFTSNQASYGGAVFFLPLTINVSALDDGQLGIFAFFKSCLFADNSAVEVGGAFGVAFHILAQSAQFIQPLQFIDCKFTRNTVIGGGVVSTAYFPLSFHGTNVFSFNQGPSLAVVGSRVRLYGSLRFSSNSNTGSLDGGALYLTSLGQLELAEGASLSFINNNGTLGAAIVVQNPPIRASQYSRLLYNPLCSVIHSDSRLPPDLWNASITFSSNHAVVAAAVFMNNLNFCSWERLTPPFFNTSRVFRWDSVDFPKESPNENVGHGNPINQSYSIQSPAVRLKIVQNQVVAFPGETVSLGVFAVDELGVATSALFTLSDDSIVTGNGSQDADGELYRFTPSSLNLEKVGPNTRLDVSLSIRRNSLIGRREVATAKMITDNRKFLTIRDTFSVTSRFCPPGSKLLGMGNYSECMCDSADVDIINCDGRRVHLEDHLWGTAVLPQMDVDNLLVTVACPGGYCKCSPLDTSGVLKCTHIFDARDPDAQCHCNRTGVLCGNCVEGSGFSALLDRCVSCSDAYSVLMVVLALVDAGVVLLLLAVSKPIPLWFYPVLHYLQLLPYFTTHFPVTFEQVRPYLVYVSSALGLYFPYDFCLYDEASPLASYAFRYLPLLVAAVLSPIALCFRKRRSPRDSWHGAWWMIVLLYTPAVHTSVSILHCPSFPVLGFNSTNGISTDARWFVNGNIQCFTGAHIALSLLAIVILFLSSSLVPLLFLVIFAEEKQLSRRPRWFELAVAAFEQSFKFWWWGPLELFRRLVLVILSVAFPRNNYPIMFTLVVFIGVTSFIKPYGHRESHKRSKKGYSWAVNILDVFLASNILILLLLRNTQYLEDTFEELPKLTSSSSDSCPGDDNQLTLFTIILTPFYYLPLVVSLSALLVWLASLTTTAVRHYRNSKREGASKDGGGEGNGVEGKEVKARTQTVIDFRTYNPDDMEPSLASPGTPMDSLTATRRPSISLTSWIYKLSSLRRSIRKNSREQETPAVELKAVLESRPSEERSDTDDKDNELEKTHKNILEENDDSHRSTDSSDCSVTEI